MDKQSKGRIDWPVFAISGGLLTLFVIIALIDISFIEKVVSESFAWSANYFGAFWQVLMLATFFVGIWLGFSKYGKIKMGNMDKPEIGLYKWLSIIMATLLAGGGVFWAAAEPMWHFLTAPPSQSGVESGTEAAINPALAQSFMHWGFLAWAILGTISAVVMMYGHYQKGMPMKPRTLLYPIFGEKLRKSFFGTIIDAFAVIAVAAGTIGPIGFLGLQASYGLQEIFGIPNTFSTQFTIILVVVLVSTISAVSGLYKGIQMLSSFNVRLALGLMIFIVIFGPGGFIIDHFLSGFGYYVDQFIPMSTYRGDEGWLSLWTVFFWGWFIGYGPMMAILVSRISRGRTIREIIVAVSVFAPIISTFWFTVLGGSGIFFEMENPGSVSNALNEAGNPAAMFAITGQFPLAEIVSPLFLILTILFVVTTSDSMSYTIAMAVTGEGNPQTWLRVFWAVLMGAIAVILLITGDSGITQLQNFIVVTAVPVSLLLLPMIWLAPKVAKTMAVEQRISKK
ncbi:BCCT family transporter [Halobacillus litoralis]|uniref:BCCT family transporter n=1 Tax=Halobacillus litoralis TaxID=45668 RepID=A0A845DRZ8_9BACI|nr:MULTISPECIES: BCCT family transporter [Halobacillus]MCA1020821.1 BCCT family transporter [Halobacillus litoralis]MYL20343.1 BCCT family transporter [Halobacillus litoralis]MYL29438.1 BCCT family transporter [Halobacillus halophilus]MYL36655.1 BCCT family transporter [Halobacillus litoralis]